MYSFIIIIYNKIISSSISLIKEENAKVNSSIIELINGINTIKSLNIVGKSKEEFSYLYNDYLNISYDLTKRINKKKSIDSIISNLITLIILAIGGSLVIKEELNISSLITINSIIFYNFSSLSKILNFDLIIKKTKIIIERINELLNIKEEKLFFDLNPLKNINGNITINNLTYKYRDNYVFKNFSMTFEEGKKILITGDSGCGKSTLAKLISGFIEVKRNKIFIGKNDLNDINLWNLREQVTYVSQDEYLFNNTIFENINIKNTRDKNKVMEIARCMLIDEIASKNPSGYNMILEENARNISGGERQRIILARTFLKNSNIYILDETFSEINIEKERIILKNIFEKFKDKTIIVISHRLNNNDLYDKIYNMEEYGSRFISKKFQE
jgi:ATP-binding cassette subfamily B protein